MNYMRWVVSVILFIGLFCNYMLRIHLDFAITQMVGNSTDHSKSIIQYNWSPFEKSWVLSSYFYGYILLQIPGGRLAERFGTRNVLGISMLGSVAVSYLLPVLASLSPWAVVAARIIQGLFLSPTYPSIPPLFVKWTPLHERSKFVSFSYSGANLGPVITFPLCGLIMDSAGWQMVFYTTASISLVWCIFWFIFVSESPETNRWISEEELDYILKNRDQGATTRVNEESKEPPLLKIVLEMLKNPKVWVIIAYDFAFCWGLYAFLVMGPTFIDTIATHGDENKYTQNGLLTMMPFLAQLFCCQIFGVVSDLIIAKGWVSRINAQKIFASLTLIPSAIAPIAMGFLTASPLYCVLVITVGFAFAGATGCGGIQNIMLMAPNRSGTFLGISNGFGNLAGALTPMVANWLIDPHTGLDPITGWRVFFATATVLNVLAATLFLLFAGDRQQKFDTIMTNTQQRNEDYSMDCTNNKPLLLQI